jgi:protein phosphatase
MSRVEARFGDGYVVSDGMGGHRGGAIAAELTTEILSRALSDIPSISSAPAQIKAAFEEANRIVYERGHSDDNGIRDMGATAVVLLIGQSLAIVAHVGDSRAYLFEQAELRRLTKDHSRVQRMVDAGILTEEQAINHPASHLLERAVGVAPDIQADISSTFNLNAGDLLLLCSDGLHGYVSDSEIAGVLNRRIAVQVMVDMLVDLALEKGGEDNITVQLIGYDYSGRGRWTPIAGLT